MTETEFWSSTLAKVTALYRVQIQDWAYTRDHFVADITSTMLNKMRREKSDKVWSPDDLLESKYPPRKRDSVMHTHDPDRGAMGNWRDLRGSFKSFTDNARRKARTRRLNAKPVK